MPDLWGYKKEALLRAAKEIEPDTVSVSLTTGLWLSAEKRDGRSTTIVEYRLKPHLTFADMNRY